LTLFSLFPTFAKKTNMKNLLLISIVVLSGALFAQNTGTVNHNLTVSINPSNSEISVTDSVLLIGDFEREFLLNAIFTPVSLTKKVSFEKITDDAHASDVGMDRDDVDGGTELKLTRWQITGKVVDFVVSYQGKIDYEIEQSEENYQRGFAQSPGIIDDLGVYLAGSTYWIPTFEDITMTYSLTTELPNGWKNVSQGERTEEGIVAGKHIDTWVCDKPQEEVFLIAAKFNVYSHDMNS